MPESSLHMNQENNTNSGSNLSETPKQVLTIPSVVKVVDLASMLNKPVTEIIKILLANGVLVTINDNIDFETAAILGDDLGFEAVEEKSDESEAVLEDDDEEGEVGVRNPIVTVMGHVDHGKTSLLDYIRETRVVQEESGGITQHIGSYQVAYKDQKITFLDTPGHAAFSAIRAQGTKVTDVVVLVVAADDGVKPQTVEAIKLAQAVNVPIIVAVTKIDKADKNLDLIKQQLGEHGVLTEAWGGKVPLVGVSAKTGEGVDELLELISLTSEIAELTARQTGKARGVVIEAQHDVKVGQLATVIIKSGKLSVGDNFVVGGTYGKVKAMQDYNGKRIKEALPSTPVSIIGFADAPVVGDILMVVDDEKTARSQAAKNRVSFSGKIAKSQSDISALVDQIKSQQVQNLNVVIKTDVQGSLQAITDQLNEIVTDRGNKIVIISSGVGNISENDVLAAAGGNAFVVGFKVRALPGAIQMAKKENIKILDYSIIYELTKALADLLVESVGLKKTETVVNQGEVLKVFRTTPKQKIVGVKVGKGEIKTGQIFRVHRNEELIGDGNIVGIKQGPKDVDTANEGEFGFSVEITSKVKEKDKIEFVQVEHIKSKLVNEL